MKDQFVNTAKMLLQIKQKIKYLKEHELKTSIRLREICDHKTTSMNGYTYKKIDNKGLVQYAEIPELQRINLDLYRSEDIVSWKLSYQKQFKSLLEKKDERV